MTQQTSLGLDDGAGLRVVTAVMTGEQKFDWDLFRGYDRLRVLTYSASIPAIVRMLDDYEYTDFECVFGSERTLRDVKDVLAFQQLAVGDARAAIRGFNDERKRHILGEVRAGRARFRVLRKEIAHSKLYLLESSTTGARRVVVGSANLSEAAFSGKQSETLVKFDDDDRAWSHYVEMYEGIRNLASDEIALPEERIDRREIELEEIPTITDGATDLVIDQRDAPPLEITVPGQLERIEKVAAAIEPKVASVLPPVRNGLQRVTPQLKREISRIKLVRSAEEADNRYLSIDRINGTATLSDEAFSMEYDPALVRADARIMLDYFESYEGNFEGDVARLQRDYFILWSWLYFAPFMCDLRFRALVNRRDVIRYPVFAIAFGKSNCGKSSLVKTLMISMFGKLPDVDKSSFTRARLRALQQAYKRHPVVFEDIGRRQFREHGLDMIKDESLPPVAEYPGFVVSMNQERTAFPDEIVKRALMIYTTTALPLYDEELRQRMDEHINVITDGLTGHLFKRYASTILDKLAGDELPEDWLLLSSATLSEILADAAEGAPPPWCQPVTWLDYADKRYDRIKDRLNGLLRPSAMTNTEGETPNGWTLDGDRVIVWEQRDAFGRRGFDWEDIPSTLVDEDASGGGRTVLHKAQLENFLDRKFQSKRAGWLARIGVRSR